MRVVVAMSGGVDSSVAAGLLVEQGHEVIGVHMKLHDQAVSAVKAKSGCGLDDALDARVVADKLDIPFYVMNLKAAFKKAVINDFVDSYKAGATPNPCIQCNGVLKFKVLMARAVALGADALATGHYAQVEQGEDGPTLLAAVDPGKDQSYFLFPISTDALTKTLFPLGGMTKAEVRAHAKRLGMVTADKPESQDVCFVPDDDHARLVKEMHPDVDASGEIVNEAGDVLGYHDGYYRYTVGQRKGLGIALGKPAYVLSVDPTTARVVVSTDADRLLHQGLIAARCNWFDRPTPEDVVHVRIRHRGALIPCTISEGDVPTVQFHEAGRAVAPGQAAVFYRGATVLGGGFITKALEAA